MLFYYWLIRSHVLLVIHGLSALLNGDRLICFLVAEFHVNKKRHQARMIRNSRHPPWQLHCSNRLPLTMKTSSCTQFPSSDASKFRRYVMYVTFTAFTASHIAISVFFHLFHSLHDLMSLEALCTLLIGDNRNVPPFSAAGGVRSASCFALAALYSGVACQLDFILVFLHCLKMTKHVSSCSGPVGSTYVIVLHHTDSFRMGTSKLPAEIPCPKKRLTQAGC